MSRKSTISFCLIVLMCVTTSAQTVNVPLEHWAYDFLDRMQVRGIVRESLPVSRPFPRIEVGAMLAEIERAVNAQEIILTRAEYGLFQQLKGEFHQELEKLNISFQDRFRERHLFRWRDKDKYITTDLLFQQRITIQKSDQMEGVESVSQTTLGGIVRGQFGDHFGFNVMAQNTLTKGDDIVGENFDPSQGLPITISGDNAYSDDASAYLVWKLPWLEVQFGRDRAQWGPGYRGSLMLSAANPRFDMLKIRANHKMFRFTSIHGKLNSGIGDKYLAAHRLELRLARWLILSASECVIYGGRGIEPMYLNPVMPYHVAEHHLGDRDNNTMSLDAVVFPKRNHKVYFELFIDDFTTAKNPFTYYGNKFAFLTGWKWVAPFGLANADLLVEYVRIEPYVYTHKDNINVYTNYDVSIGHWLGPNSDDLFIRGAYLISRNLQLGLNASRTRHGEGNINTPHDASQGTRKKFLSGIVETAWRLGLECRWQAFRDALLTLAYTFSDTRNLDRTQGLLADHHRFFIHFSLNY